MGQKDHILSDGEGAVSPTRERGYLGGVFQRHLEGLPPGKGEEDPERGGVHRINRELPLVIPGGDHGEGGVVPLIETEKECPEVRGGMSLSLIHI